LAGGSKPKPSSRTVSATKRRRLARLTGPPAAQIAGRLGDDPGGRGRERGQLGVELRLAAEGEQRDATLGARPPEDVERRFPRRTALVEPNQHGADTVQRRRRRAGVEPDTTVGPHRREPGGE
jgi:hypothetical protein